MNPEAIGGASSQLASLMSSAAAQGNQMMLAEAQISASDAVEGQADAINSSVMAPGSFEAFA